MKLKTGGEVIFGQFLIRSKLRWLEIVKLVDMKVVERIGWEKVKREDVMWVLLKMRAGK